MTRNEGLRQRDTDQRGGGEAMNFSAMRDGYLSLWSTASVRPEHVAEVDAVVDRICSAPTNLAQYVAVQHATGIPAYVVGIIHVREASQNFRCHLHNGDPLDARTVHVPAGRPLPPEEPPFAWEESAIDALTMPGQDLQNWHDWSPAGIAYILERYNGFGYRNHGVNSPYLWGFTTAYTSGLYVADGQWDAAAVNGNPGGMAMLRRMVDRKLITLPQQPDSAAPAPMQQPVAPVTLGAVPDLHVVVDQVRSLQSYWQALGIYDGRLDGDPGPMFAEACTKFHQLVS
jgi:lysozyme family protein